MCFSNNIEHLLTKLIYLLYVHSKLIDLTVWNTCTVHSKYFNYSIILSDWILVLPVSYRNITLSLNFCRTDNWNLPDTDWFISRKICLNLLIVHTLFFSLFYLKYPIENCKLRFISFTAWLGPTRVLVYLLVF